MPGLQSTFVKRTINYMTEYTPKGPKKKILSQVTELVPKGESNKLSETVYRPVHNGEVLSGFKKRTVMADAEHGTRAIHQTTYSDTPNAYCKTVELTDRSLKKTETGIHAWKDVNVTRTYSRQFGSDGIVTRDVTETFGASNAPNFHIKSEDVFGKDAYTRYVNDEPYFSMPPVSRSHFNSIIP